MTSFVWVAAIAVLSMFVMSRPLFAKAAAVEDHAVPYAGQMRKEALEALNELEYDYQMNKISKEDYEAMTLPYKQLVMQQMAEEQQPLQAADRLKHMLEDEIEQELQARLKGRA